MPLLIAPIIALVTMAHNGTRNYEVCLKENFKHPACYEAEQLYKAGKFGCEKLSHNKTFDGSSSCKPRE